MGGLDSVHRCYLGDERVLSSVTLQGRGTMSMYYKTSLLETSLEITILQTYGVKVWCTLTNKTSMINWLWEYGLTFILHLMAVATEIDWWIFKYLENNLLSFSHNITCVWSIVLNLIEFILTYNSHKHAKTMNMKFFLKSMNINIC